MLRSDQGLAVVGSFFRQINSADELLPDSIPFPVDYVDLLGAFLTCNAILHPTAMFRREVVIASGNYSPCPAPCEDFDLWMRVAKTHRIGNIGTSLLYYRIHERGIINSFRDKGILEEPNLRCIQRHSFELFGLSPQLYGRLRRNELAFSVFVLIPVAVKIARRARSSLFRVLGSSAFLYSARCLTSRRDVLSRLFWRLCERVFAA
jgi:hypothetical protein